MRDLDYRYIRKLEPTQRKIKDYLDLAFTDFFLRNSQKLYCIAMG
jgi:hypothetical protein